MSALLRKLLIVLAVIAALGVVIGLAARAVIVPLVFGPTPSAVEDAPPTPTNAKEKVTVMAKDLHTPWEIATLPDGGLLITERDGNLRRIFPDGTRKTYAVPGVVEYGEAGLLGMVLHPDFKANNLVYLYSTTRYNDRYVNRVIRYHLDADGLKEEKTIVGDIPAAKYHDGGRIDFGPDGKLYVATGDANDTKNAQSRDSLAGKILRVEEDGAIPADNPYGNATWSYGHRNPQGIAWDDRGRLWATEHGRSGASTGYDELNLIEKGANYGWPLIQGDETREGMRAAVINSGPTETWAPSGIAFIDGRLFFAGLRGSSLYEARIDEAGTVTRFRAHARREFGRLRAVRVAGRHLLISTSNTDGRGSAQEGDDKILRLDLGFFE